MFLSPSGPPDKKTHQRPLKGPHHTPPTPAFLPSPSWVLVEGGIQRFPTPHKLVALSASSPALLLVRERAVSGCSSARRSAAPRAHATCLLRAHSMHPQGLHASSGGRGVCVHGVAGCSCASSSPLHRREPHRGQKHTPSVVPPLFARRGVAQHHVCVWGLGSLPPALPHLGGGQSRVGVVGGVEDVSPGRSRRCRRGYHQPRGVLPHTLPASCLFGQAAGGVKRTLPMEMMAASHTEKWFGSQTNLSTIHPREDG